MAHLDAEAFAALFSGQSIQTLQHLLTCARCRRSLSDILFDLTATEEAQDPLEGLLADSPVLLRAIERLASEARRPRNPPEAELLAQELLRLPREIRLDAIEAQRASTLLTSSTSSSAKPGPAPIR